MASLRNAMKTQHVHKERHQPIARQHLGALEKKKDYKIRAKDQNAKRKALKTLRKRALNKNPDEFHYHMINSGLKDGIHFEKVENEELAVGDVMQDLVYITHRLTIEKKKIEKLKAQLHVLDMEDDEPKNTHIIFVDDEKEAKKADPAKLLDTHPSLLNRSFNRLHSSQLSSLDNNLHDQALLTTVSNCKRKAYKELAQRIERGNKLRIMKEKLEVRKKLMENKAKNGEKPKLVKPGTNTSAPIYQWPKQRKT
nr:probable U3 small nucleolar RNA-associated protein 11 [Cherax quadricarinatus]XP_053626578.1 probable U3 small nucleolar RNA-associated protein 11 [Cherax quadricarinatus]XP_053626579.1 probable U3 small nucleolar RNA-associated protein 11 [Cherax quadricarinatus]XP_053626580.1 probable U3 small nucleolar RNA-associated protein 11 [Cherax quadricarinatus]XP_053626581.1 probable U3 small nucleolar RNA-associated protein 11 [Cherax quadricarinatus]